MLFHPIGNQLLSVCYPSALLFAIPSFCYPCSRFSPLSWLLHGTIHVRRFVQSSQEYRFRFIEKQSSAGRIKKHPLLNPENKFCFPHEFLFVENINYNARILKELFLPKKFSMHQRICTYVNTYLHIVHGKALFVVV